MPFVLIIFGILLLSTAFKGNTGDLTEILKKDLTGSANDIMAIVAILAVGAVGFIPKMKVLSDSFLVLILVSMMVADKGGFFKLFQQQLAQFPALGGTGVPATPTTSLSTSVGIPGLKQGLDLSQYGFGRSQAGLPIIPRFNDSLDLGSF